LRTEAKENLVIRAQSLRLSRGGFGSFFAVLGIAVVFAGLASSDRALAATRTVGCGAGSFATIQDAVNAAIANDTIQVCSGIYTEQVVIPTTKSGLNLQSQPTGAATIKAPPSLPATQSSAIVHVDGATGVTVNGFTIDGPGTGGCGTIGYGVLVDGGGSATVSADHITNIRDNPFSGCQNGVGIAAGCCLPTGDNVQSKGTVTATGNRIEDYQKSAIDLRGEGSTGTISGNTMVGAGPTKVIGQNGIQISRGASATVSGNTVSANVYTGNNVATGMIIRGSVGKVTISGNTLNANDAGIYTFNATSVGGPVNATVSGNTVSGGNYGIVVDGASSVRVEQNSTVRAANFGLYATKDASGNTFLNNIASGATGEGNYDCRDESSGGGTAGTANTWTKDIGEVASPDGICSLAISEDVPPVIVLPPTPGTGPPVPAGPPGQQAGNKIVTKMRRNQLRSCVIEVRALGPSHLLVARGVAHAPTKGTGRLIVRINVKPKGKQLLSKNFGGVIVNVRALCRSSSGTLHRAVRRVRALLLIEHRLTPPGSWVPDQPILTGTGHSFMSSLRHRMFAVRFIRCDGYTATWPPSPAFPPTLSLNRAKRVCGELKRVGGPKARVRLVPHGLTDPIATNSSEAGRRVNRRVFVTIVHVFVFRS
jgi:Right handed beta helix region